MRALNLRHWTVEYARNAQKESSLVDLLLNRQGISPEAADAYFTPSPSDLNDPFLFRDMALAVELIAEVIFQQGHILIYGDYDCDGISATALLMRFLRNFTVKVDYLLPSRLNEGYGLNLEAVRQIVSAKPDLLITVDNGSASAAEVTQLLQAGIKVIVTDHHQVAAEIPQALAFLNPCYEGDAYPFPHLAGVGVALQLVRALRRTLEVDVAEDEYFTLAALGTIADAMPLVAENRTIVSLGIQAFALHAPPGLRRLADTLRPSGAVDAEFLAYSIASRINASGRLDNTEPAMTLLLSDDDVEIEAAITALEALNEERRTIEADILTEADRQVKAQNSADKAHILVVAGDDWHPGVIGIVSSRLADKYHLPCVCLAAVEQEYRGSARTAGSFDVLQALLSVEEICISVGGHREAAGVSLARENLPIFAQELRQYASRHSKDFLNDEAYPVFSIIRHEELQEDLFSSMQRFEPFGSGNEKPSFVVENVQLVSIKRLGDGSHLRLICLLEDQREVSGIAFRMGEFSTVYQSGDIVDFVAQLNKHEYKGRVYLQLQILDMRPGQAARLAMEEAYRLSQAWLAGQSLSTLVSSAVGLEELSFSPPIVANFWRFLELLLSMHHTVQAHIALLARSYAISQNSQLSAFACARILDIFHEAGLILVEQLSGQCVRLSLKSPSERRPTLSEQTTWQRLQAEGGIIA